VSEHQIEGYGAGFFRDRGWWRDETLLDWLDHNTSNGGDSVAIATVGAEITYRELNDRVYQTASALHKLGIGRGDIVAVQLPNIPEFIISWLAINARGAAMQTIHLPYGLREVDHLLRHSGAKAVIALGAAKDRSPAGELLTLRGNIPSLQFIISVGRHVAGAEEFGRMIANDAELGQVKNEAIADDPFLLLYTSGTTSAPKAVSASFNHFLSNARLAANEFNLTSNDRILCLAPFTHLYGLYTLQLGLCVGASACLVPAFTPSDFIEALRRMQPTVLFGAPGHIAACMQQRLFQDVDLESIRIAVLSGTTVPPTLSAAFEHMLPRGKVMQAWGMTELQFGTCGRPTDTRDVRFNSVGRAMPGTELRIADTSNRILPSGETGELHMRGCSVFSGYVRNSEATGDSFTTDGWFRTGDLAEMDEDGNVRLRGRTKDIINRGGVKFNPIEVEGAIASHPAVAQVAIAPVPDQLLGERAACFVVLNERATLALDDLKQFLAARNIAKFMWPEQLEIVTEMPMTPTRKVIKTELVERLLAQLGNRGRPAA
jgi:cyclohexanecarboxylate-CoA ligase/acyl-CoA synthetase